MVDAQGAAKLAGLDATSSTAISASASSYAAPCLKLKNDGVDALFVADNFANVQRATGGCVQQGWKVAQFSQGSTASPVWLKDANMDGAQLADANALLDDSTPAGKAALDAIAKYGKNQSEIAASGLTTTFAWTSGKLFEAAVKAGGLTPTSTPADVTKAMYKIPAGETLDGLAPPLSFTKGAPTLVPCYFSAALAGAKFVAMNGNKPTCLTAPQLKGLAAALQGLAR